jgi:hypothetical protein
MQAPYVSGVTEVHRGDWLTAASIGYALGGVAGAINASANPGGRVEDHTPEFKAGVAAALREADLQQLLLAALERTMKAKTGCQTAYRRVTFPMEAPQGSTERIVGVGGQLLFQGGKPVLKAMMSASVIAKDASIERLNQDGEAMMKLSEELRTMPPRKLIKSGKLAETQTVSKRIETYIDGMQMFQGGSPAHSTEEWLAGDGQQIRREIDAVMDGLAAQLAATLFP